jgi:hypothetical protein
MDEVSSAALTFGIPLRNLGHVNNSQRVEQAPSYALKGAALLRSGPFGTAPIVIQSQATTTE